MFVKILKILHSVRGIELPLPHQEYLLLMNKLVPVASGRKNKIPNKVEFLNELVSIWIWYGNARLSDLTDAVIDGESIDNERAIYIKESIEQIINESMTAIFFQNGWKYLCCSTINNNEIIK